jgi:excinuclease ABC subunit C
MISLSSYSLPEQPGVYIYKNKENKIIYIGKAKNLKKRILSYFQKNHKSIKTEQLVKQIADIDYIIVDTEQEALLLENQLIKHHKPKYNILLKDSKTYPYIIITKEDIPHIEITRKKNRKADYFGPFSDKHMRDTLFQLCVTLFQIIHPKTYSSKSKLYYEIGLAPAKSKSEIDKKHYLQQVEQAKQLLKGMNIPTILKTLTTKMIEYANVQEFEKALYLKQQIQQLKQIQEQQKVDLKQEIDQDYIISYSKDEKTIVKVFTYKKGLLLGKEEFSFNTFQDETLPQFIKQYYSTKSWSPKEIILENNYFENRTEKKEIELFLSTIRESKVSITIPQKGKKKKLLQMLAKNIKTNHSEKVLEELQKHLNLPKIPNTIECFDMSNLNNEHFIGAMTQWINGKPNPSGYRKYSIRTLTTKPNDLKATQEVLFRRYSSLKKQEYPDLIIIDGGRTHLTIAQQTLQTLNITIPIISIAKGVQRNKNEIYINDNQEPIVFDNSTSFMLLLRKIRDSVHNYVIRYNRKKQELKLKKEFK